MGKKRAREADGLQGPVAGDSDKMDEDSSDDDNFDVVNVDFEWFNFDPDVDFHGVKSLLRQLLDVDSQLIDLSGLANMIVEQRTIGSTVKVDDKSSDAYAFLTALSLAEHAEKPPVAELVQYLADKARSNPSLSPVADLLASKSQVGLILSERLINMPSEIVPPLYSMLVEEIQDAVDDKEPYEFSHYLIVSKAYNEVESALDQGERKKKKAKDETSLFYFHPEDEVLQKHAAAYGNYQYSKDDDSVADSKRAFQELGVKPSGFMIMIEASKFRAAVKAISDYLGAPA